MRNNTSFPQFEPDHLDALADAIERGDVDGAVALLWENTPNLEGDDDA